MARLLQSFFWGMFGSFFLFTSGADALWVSSDAVVRSGGSTNISISGALGDENMTVHLQRPDKSIMEFSTQADEWGTATHTIEPINIAKVGNYIVGVERSFDTSPSEIITFSVIAGSPSAHQSVITLDKNTTKAGDGSGVKVTVRARDSHKNPVANARIVASTSRNADTVRFDTETNADGIATGVVTSDVPGISVLNMMVEGAVLYEKPEIVFTPKSTMENTGASGIGNFLQAQLFDDNQELLGPNVAYFEVSGLADTVMTDDNLTMQIVAKNEDGETVSDYTGTVRFVSSDAKAVLPTDYTFLPTDQGSHEFALAVRFLTLGTQILSVHDLNDFRVSGEWTGTVNDRNNNPEAEGEKSISLLTPQAGSYSSVRITVSGTATGCNSVVIKDNSLALVEDLAVGNDGNFSFQTPPLGTGEHSFQAICASDSSIMSDVRTVDIDRTAPQALAVEILPNENLAAGAEFTVNMTASEELASASCTFEGLIKELYPSGNAHTESFFAPEKCGTYSLDCKAADVLGNEVEEKAVAMITTCADGTGPEPEVIVENYPTIDTDEDGMTDKEEMKDTDGDGVPDYLESSTADNNNNGTPDDIDPENDSDGDGVSNMTEYRAGCNPMDSKNRAEVVYNSVIHLYSAAQVDRINKQFSYVCTNIETTDLDENDSDAAGVGDDVEGVNGTDPYFVGDDYSQTDSAIRDSDGDGILDSAEMNDDDKDGVPNWIESNTVDTDEDGIMDQKDGTDDRSDGLNSPTALTAVRGEEKVTLMWAPSAGEDVAKYIVEFCTVEAPVVCNENITPDNRTQWYVEPLKTGMDYEFVVRSMSSDGEKSAPSKPVISGPISYEKVPVDNTPSSGPEGSDGIPPFVVMLMIALLSGFGVILLRGKRA